MKRVPVSITSNGIVIADQALVVRRTPDGRLGATFQGMVYPLGAGSRIDLSGECWYPTECDAVRTLPDELAPGEADVGFPWRLALDGVPPVLYLGGDTAVLDPLVAILDRAHLRPGRVGALPGGSSDPFRWFIRLDVAPDAIDPWAVARMLRDAAAQGSDGARGDDDADVWRHRALRAEAEVVRLEQEAVALQQEVDDERLDRERDAALIAAETALLRASITALRGEIEDERGRRAAASAEFDALRADLLAARHSAASPAEIARLERDLFDALEQWQAAEAVAETARSELEAVQARMAELEALATRAQRLGSGGAPDSGGRQRRLAMWRQICDTLLPRLDLVGHSLDVIAFELVDRQSVFTTLEALHNAPETLASKRVQGAEGWLERHFSTGAGHDGRIYFKRLGREARYRVLVSDKGAQPRDMVWMKGQ